MKKLLFLIYSFNICFLVISVIKCTTSTNEFPEITSEEFSEFEAKYVIETNESEKKYLEAVIRPEKFDLNKDRKISKEELREALIYVSYPKDKKERKRIPEELDTHLKNNIKLYVDSLKFDKLNFKQFSYLMRKVSVTQFMVAESVESQIRAREQKRLEGESEL